MIVTRCSAFGTGGGAPTKSTRSTRAPFRPAALAALPTTAAPAPRRPAHLGLAHGSLRRGLSVAWPFPPTSASASRGGGRRPRAAIVPSNQLAGRTAACGTDVTIQAWQQPRCRARRVTAWRTWGSPSANRGGSATDCSGGPRPARGAQPRRPPRSCRSAGYSLRAAAATSTPGPAPTCSRPRWRAMAAVISKELGTGVLQRVGGARGGAGVTGPARSSRLG